MPWAILRGGAHRREVGRREYRSETRAREAWAKLDVRIGWAIARRARETIMIMGTRSLRYYEVRRRGVYFHPMVPGTLSNDHDLYLALVEARNEAASRIVPDWGSLAPSDPWPSFDTAQTAESVGLLAQGMLSPGMRARADDLLAAAAARP